VKNTRDRLIAAAETVLRERGLSHLSTREVARAAGVAEGALYHHFEDKNELILAVIAGNGPRYLDSIRNLPLSVGLHTVRENLEGLAWVTYDFHRHAIPITCALLADTALLERHRRILRANKVGPTNTYEALNGYLGAEQRMGRIAKKQDPIAVSTLLIGACFQLAFLETYWAQKVSRAEARKKTDGIVASLMIGLEPSRG
jgi:AcrR family transcriptional regulator